MAFGSYDRLYGVLLPLLSIYHSIFYSAIKPPRHIEHLTHDGHVLMIGSTYSIPVRQQTSVSVPVSGVPSCFLFCGGARRWMVFACVGADE